MKRILVPVDGSKFAEAALPTAVAIATRAGAQLSLVMVGVPENPPSGVWADAFRENHESYLAGLVDRVAEEAGEVDVSATLLDGAVVESLTEEIGRWEPDLIVMTTHGRGGLARAWLGSIADALLREGSTPTLLVRPEEGDGAVPRWGDPMEVLVPVDGSRFAEAALGVTNRLVKLFDARITLVRVVPFPSDTGSVIGGMVVDYRTLLDSAEEDARNYVETLVGQVEESVPRVDAAVLLAPSAAAGILEKAEDIDADVIVVASHTRGGVGRIVLGSTADKLVRGAKRSVLVVPMATAAD